MSLFSPESENELLFYVSVPCAFVVLAVNVPLIVSIGKRSKKTLIDQLIGFDCLFAILNVPLILQAARVIDPCWFL